MAHFKDHDEPYDLFIGIPVHKVPDVLVEAGLTENGWVKVDPFTLATPFPGVYALGDCAETGIPKAGVFAESAARTVADEIAASIRGSRARPYDGTGLCFVEMGDGEVGRVDVHFRAKGGPTAPLLGPSAEYAAEKAEFGQSVAPGGSTSNTTDASSTFTGCVCRPTGGEGDVRGRTRAGRREAYCWNPRADVDRTEALSERLFANAVGALELYTIYLGERLGLYRALAEGGAATSTQLAERTGTTERYLREWLEHQAAVSCSWSMTRGRNHWLAATGCRRSTSPSWQTPTTSDTRPTSASTSSRRSLASAGGGVSGWERAAALPWEPRVGRRPTGPCSSTCLAPSGSLRLSTSMRGFGPNRQRGSSMWPAAPAGRASPWPRRTPRSTWTVSISTRTPSARSQERRRAGVADRVRFSVADAADLAERAGMTW